MAVSPVPIAQTGSYASVIFWNCSGVRLKTEPSSCALTTWFCLPASLSSFTSPMQNIGLSWFWSARSTFSRSIS